jgi:integrase
VRKPQGLYRRSAVYYWRRIVPRRHVDGGRPAEIRISLKTTAYGRAVARARRLSAAMDRQLQAIVESMKADRLSPQQWSALLRAFIEDELDQMETLRADQDVLAPEAVDASARTWTMIAEGWRENLANNNLEPVAQLAYAFLAGQGVEVDPASPRFKRFARDILRALAKIDLINAERARGHYREDDQPFTPTPIWADPTQPLDVRASAVPRAQWAQHAAPQNETEEVASAPPVDDLARRFGEVLDLPSHPDTNLALTLDSLLSEALAVMEQIKESEKKWTPETRRRTRNSCDLIIAILGDRSLKSYRREEVLKAREVMTRIPANHGKSRTLKLSVEDAIKAADRLERQRLSQVRKGVDDGTIDRDNAEEEFLKARVRRLEPKTINHHLSNVGQIFKFAREIKGVPVENPFFKTRFDRRVVAQSPTRKVRLLDDDDMERLFRSPLFTGCKSPARRWLPGKLILRDDLYWVLLLEAFAGLRLEEACQLTPDDIRTFFGVPWFVIHSTGANRTKSKASNRCVPVHNFLVELGFLDYVERMKGLGRHRLFAGLTRDTRGRLGGKLSKYYTNYRRRIGLDAPGKDGHALRHAFDTYLHNAGVPSLRISELMGHERDNMTEGTYFHGSRPALLWQAINRLTYGFKVTTIDGEPQLVRDVSSGWTIPGMLEDAAKLRPVPAKIIDAKPLLPKPDSSDDRE